MPLKRGISLIDLIGLPPGSSMIVSSTIGDVLERLAVLDCTSVTAGDVHIHRGTVQSLADAGFPSLNNWPIETPMINAGLPFQLIKRRAPLGFIDNVEPAAAGWQLDLMLDRVAWTIPGLRPALRVESQGTTPRHLVPDPTRTGVRIVGGGTLRFVSQPAVPLRMMFVSPADPVDPDAPNGCVFDLAFDPPHFFIGKSKHGMTVDRLAYDNSDDFTPAEISARGHGADWEGLSIREATYYAPRNAPVVGDLSAGVRDLIIGIPFGMQGELQVEFGVPKTSPSVLQFFQNEVNGGLVALDPNLVETAGGRTIVSYVNLPEADVGRVKANAPGEDPPELLFTLPDGSQVRGPSSGYFDVRTGHVLCVQTVEKVVSAPEAFGPRYEVHFHEGGSPHVPTIGVSFKPPLEPITIKDPAALADVIFISGRREHLQGLLFTASAVEGADVWEYQWAFGAGLGADISAGATFAPLIPPTLGNIDLRLTDDEQRTRRLRVEVVTEGPLVLGTATGAWMVDDAHVAHPLKLRGLEGAYNAATFDGEGLLTTTTSDAAVDLASGQIVSSAGTKGTVLAATVDMGHPDAGPYAPAPGAPPFEVKRHLQVVMEFGTTEGVGWGMQGLAKPYSIGVLQEWALQFGSEVQFVIIGRTCDIELREYDEELADLRAKAGQALLSRPDVMLIELHARSELDKPADIEASITSPMTEPEKAQGSLIKAEQPDLHGGDQYLPLRSLYRRIDIYALFGSDDEAAEKMADDQTRVGPALRRVLLPGGDVTQLVVPPPPGTNKTFRVRLSVKWDSPTALGLADFIPTAAEVLVTWDKTPSLVLPDPPQPAPPLPAGDKTALVAGPDVYTLLGRWTHDSRSGATLFSLAFNNEGGADGLAHADNNVLAAAMLMGPALLSGITANSPSGAAVRLGALLGASVGAAKFIKNGRVVVHGIEVQEQQRALGQFGDATHRILLDYTAQINVAVVNSAISITTTNPLKVRYENCGVEYDGSKTGLAALNLVYDEARFDVEDPGEWVIGGKLGKLLRVAGTRAGSGSVWFEVDLEFAIDMGPIKLTGCTVRITFPTEVGGAAGFELRGLAVEINVPKVLEGKGRLALGKQGEFKSDIQVKVIPAEVEARASLVLSDKLKYLEVGVRLPMGIPLGTSGLGIFGFMGRFVVNGRRDMPTAGDAVENEIAWYRLQGVKKYTVENAEGQYALGLGVVLGTLPDTGFTFGATGMLTVAFPDPEVVISVDAKLFRRPELEASDNGATEGEPALEMLGIIAANEHEFILGIRGQYNIPQVLSLKVPISGYFPIGDASKAYHFRIGSDGVNGRSGDAVTATLLPGVADFKCWLFLMMEEKQLLNLGDAPKKWGGEVINLYGYSLGLGAGFDINWTADPFALRVGAILLLGLGTKPMTVVGMIAAEGELDLVIVSATVQARVQAQIQRIRDKATQQDKTTYWLDGAFKAEVDLGLTTISGSIHFHLDEGGKATPPEPEHPLLRVDLVDRRGALTGSALPGNAASTVWPDTTPVLHFAHKVVNALQGSNFKVGVPLPGEDWSGATELRYAFRLEKLVLRKKGGAALAGPLDSVWWWPTHKGGLINPVDPMPSQHEARALALLSWNPALATYSMADGGKGGPGDPQQTLADVCDPPVLPSRNTVLGSTATGLGLGVVQMVPSGPGAPPLPSWFKLTGTASISGKDYATVVQMAQALGKTVFPGQVHTLAAPLAVAGEPVPFTGAWELPRVGHQNYFEGSLQWDVQIANYINAPALTLAVWNRGDKAPIVTTQCDRFTDLAINTQIPRAVPRQGWRYETLNTPPQNVVVVDQHPQGAPDGKAELSGRSGMRVDFATPVHSVTVELVQWGGVVTLRAFNSSGGILAQASSTTVGNQPQKVTVAMPNGISRIQLSQASAPNIAAPANFVVREICASTTQPAAAPGVPQVSGVVQNTTAQIPWPAQLVATVPGPAGGTLQIYRCVPDPAKIWKSLRLLAYNGAHLLMLGLSGVDWVMQDLSNQNEAAKNDIKDSLNQNGNGSPGQPVTAKHLLLEAGATYEIEVVCKWAGWLKSDEQPNPPTLQELDKQNLWQSFAGAPTVFSFTVAAQSVPDSNDPVPLPPDFQNETLFDPRALQRYLLGFEPDGGLPHFLHDEIVVKFSVDYVDRLLDTYGRKLAFKLRRTDPPVGTLQTAQGPFQSPADVGFDSVNFEALDWADLPIAEQWLDPEQGLAGCVGGKLPQGQQAVITAKLEPDAEYDLMLVAHPGNQPQSDRVLIARAHFRTSRYLHPQDMLTRLGFTAKNNPLRAHDLLLAQTYSAPVLKPEWLQRDHELEEWLRSAGLDPLPLPPKPRVSLLWSPSGQSYLLGAVLIDTNEPTYRGNRMAPGTLQLTRPNLPALGLTLLRSNAAGTRLLYGLQVPMAPPAGSRLVLSLQDRQATVSGSRTAPSVPRCIFEESAT